MKHILALLLVFAFGQNVLAETANDGYVLYHYDGTPRTWKPERDGTVLLTWAVEKVRSKRPAWLPKWSPAWVWEGTVLPAEYDQYFVDAMKEYTKKWEEVSGGAIKFKQVRRNPKIIVQILPRDSWNFVYNDDKNVALTKLFSWYENSEGGYEYIYKAVISVNARDYYYRPVPYIAAPYEMVGIGHVIFHELGHCLNLGHSKDPLDILYPVLIEVATITDATKALMEAIFPIPKIKPKLKKHNAASRQIESTQGLSRKEKEPEKAESTEF